METKLARVRALLDAGDEVGALRLAARFPRLGAEKETIQRGWAALQNPELYVELGFDPDELFRAAVAAVRAKYQIGTPTE
jgi:hypothetical protein